MPTLTINPFVNARSLGRCRYARTLALNMQIKSSINGDSPVTASLNGVGNIGAHLVCFVEPDGSTRIRFNRSGFDMSDPSNTKSLSWGEEKLSEGDKISIEISGCDKEVTAPKTIPLPKRATSFTTSSEQADIILTKFNEIRGALMEINTQVANQLDGTARSEILLAVGDLMDRTFQGLALPTYRNHLDKVPKEYEDYPLG